MGYGGALNKRFARSNFYQTDQLLRASPEGGSLLPRSRHERRGSWGEATKSAKWRTLGSIRDKQCLQSRHWRRYVPHPNPLCFHDVSLLYLFGTSTKFRHGRPVWQPYASSTELVWSVREAASHFERRRVGVLWRQMFGIPCLLQSRCSRRYAHTTSRRMPVDRPQLIACWKAATSSHRMRLRQGSLRRVRLSWARDAGTR